MPIADLNELVNADFEGCSTLDDIARARQRQHDHLPIPTRLSFIEYQLKHLVTTTERLLQIMSTDQDTLDRIASAEAALIADLENEFQDLKTQIATLQTQATQGQPLDFDSLNSALNRLTADDAAWKTPPITTTRTTPDPAPVDASPSLPVAEVPSAPVVDTGVTTPIAPETPTAPSAPVAEPPADTPPAQDGGTPVSPDPTPVSPVTPAAVTEPTSSPEPAQVVDQAPELVGAPT